MKPETANCLKRAREALADAQMIAATAIYRVAAREAYVAAFHAAEGYIFERTERVAKTHRGLRTLFSEIAKSDPGIPTDFPGFLAETYELKSISDYGNDPAEIISAEKAAAAIKGAERFVITIEKLIS